MAKKILFTSDSWEHYLYWQNQDKKTAKRINQLIKDVERNGNDGIGKSEPLKGDLSGWWSKRIDDVNRLVYRINNNVIEILSCKGHYD
jgi:toxin YoeB